MYSSDADSGKYSCKLLHLKSHEICERNRSDDHYGREMRTNDWQQELQAMEDKVQRKLARVENLNHLIRSLKCDKRDIRRGIKKERDRDL